MRYDQAAAPQWAKLGPDVVGRRIAVGDNVEKPYIINDSQNIAFLTAASQWDSFAAA